MKTNYLLFTFSIIPFLWITWATNYSMEERAAYDYAYKNDITTMTSIDKANMEWNLTRIAMAKMLSNYAINILWLTPDTTKNCYFSDVSSDLDKQYDNWVTKACQLWLMGVWIDKFYPNWIVTRAEFWTVLSRALNAKDTTKLNRMNNANPYYSEHLNYLKEEWIMNNISNPNSLEMRGWVMIMLMRADKNSNYDELAKTRYFRTPMALITNKNKDEVIIKNTDELLYRNEVYGFQVLLDKYRWDGKICNWVDDSAWWKEIAFHKLWTFDYWTWDGWMIDSNTCSQVWYRVAIYTIIYDNDTYDTFLKEWYDWITWETWTLVVTTRWKNNKYYFVVRDWDPRLIRKMFLNVSCYQVKWLDWYSRKCPNHLDTIFLSGFSIFDV